MEHRKYKRARSAEASVFNIVVALCADYDRRKNAIAEREISRRVRMEYIYINTRMLNAAGEIVGFAVAESFIREIGSGIGFASSELDCVSESAYKAMKRRIKIKIAENLYLLD